MIHYSYVFVRKDIPLASQLVQTGHACMQAGHIFNRSDTHMCLLGIDNEEKLLREVEKIRKQGINIVMFYEPDGSIGFTAACTEPVWGETRKVFKKYRLWEIK